MNLQNPKLDKAAQTTQTVINIGSFAAIAHLCLTLFRLVEVFSMQVKVDIAILIPSATVQVLHAVVFFCAFRIVGTVMETVIKEGTPFVAPNVRRLKTMAVIIAVLGGTLAILCIVLSSVYAAITVVVQYALFAFIPYTLALVFDYGVQLQIQSDETL